MNRRSFLITAGALALAQSLVGCNRHSSALLQVRLLKDAMPAQLLKEFQRRHAEAKGLGFLVSEQLADLYDLLQKGSEAGAANPANQAARMADLSLLGDYWLTAAIQQKLIQPLNLEAVPSWSTLANQEIWQTLVQRNAEGQPDPSGQFWAAPYRWGTLMIAYHAEQFQKKGWNPPTDWRDLWQPEFRGYLSLPDSPRSVIGLVLKSLGRSINSENLEAVPDLQTKLTALHQQVKIYSSETYLQPLLLEDTLLAVGWSSEILPIVQRNHELAAVVPPSGTILTADLWVHPTGAAPLDAERSNLLNQWIGFCWDSQIAAQLSLLTSMAAAVFLGVDRSQLPPVLQQNQQNQPNPQQTELLLPSPEVLQNSEFLLPLTDETITQYRRLWVALRQAGMSH